MKQFTGIVRIILKDPTFYFDENNTIEQVTQHDPVGGRSRKEDNLKEDNLK